MKIHIDFETRSAADLKEVGAHEYAAHLSTDVLCLAYCFDEGPVEIWFPGQPLPQELYARIVEGHPVNAWNAAFERAIWANIMVPKYGAPPIQFEQWRCTMAKAAAVGLPQSLDGFARLLERKIQKDDKGKRIMLKLSKPKKTKDGTIDWHNNVKDFEAVLAYCKQDVEVERDADRLLPQMSVREFAVWQLDQRINERGLTIDRKLCDNAIQMVEHKQAEMNAELEILTGGEVKAVTELGKLKEWLKAKGLEFESLGAPALAQVLSDPNLPADARRALEIRQLAGKNSVAKFAAMLNRSQSGRMRGNLRYCGATTGRWSGAGAQIQNFPRGSIAEAELLAQLFIDGNRQEIELFFGDVIEAAKSVLRAAIIAAPGKKFCIWDFAQIEARILAWMAGESELITAFAEGKDIYKQFAAKVFKKSPSDISKAERFIGKTCILGLGYSMGPSKFQMTLGNYGTKVTMGFAEKCVGTYRETYPKIVKLWRKTEAQATAGIHPWTHRPAFWTCELPSGRQLYYYGAKEANGQMSYKAILGATVVREKTYGGKLVENIVQAIARDILVEGLFKLEANGFETVATVHDEVIAEVPADMEGASERGLVLLSQTPKWATGLPLAVEGGESMRYKK